jgi:hypothetical protein
VVYQGDSKLGTDEVEEGSISASPWQTVWLAPRKTGAILRERNRIMDLAQPVAFLLATVVAVSIFLSTFEDLWGDRYTPWSFIFTDVMYKIYTYVSQGALLAVPLVIAAMVIALIQKQTFGNARYRDILNAMLWGTIPLATAIITCYGTPLVYHDVENNSVTIGGVGYLLNEWWVSRGIRTAAWYAMVLSIVPAFWMTSELISGVSGLSGRQGYVQVICGAASGMVSVWLIVLALQFSAGQFAPLPEDFEPLGLPPLESLPPAPE